jgi:hypothetical protein
MHLLHKNFTTIKIILVELVLIIIIAFFNVLVGLYLFLLLTSATFYIGFLPKYEYFKKDHPYLKVENREICFKNVKFGFFGPSEHDVVEKHWN